MNRVGKYAISKDMEEIKLMNMVFELPEKDRMLMWLQGYIDQVIEKLPEYAQSILEERKVKWEDTMEYVRNELELIVNQPDFIKASKGDRKGFALYVMKKYPLYQSLLFRYYDKNLKETDLKRFVYNRRFGPKRFLS